jgi:3-hydroxyisobutyrate dehydrogenase
MSSAASSRPAAGFIGLGIMGRPMAGHLLRAGFPLTVFNRTRSKAEALAAEGAHLAETPADVARASDVMIVMVSDSPDVEAVVAGPNGVVEGVRRGAVVVDMGTVSPETERRMAEALRARGADYVDAPVSGGDVGAKNATLAIMAGGNAAALEKARPLLEKLGKSITHCGPVGSGQLAKLCNQILVGVTCLAVSEAVALARRGGLDPTTMIKAVENGAAASWQLSNLGPKIVADDVAPGFMVDLIVKDLKILERTAKTAGAVLPATDLVKRLFESAQAQGEGSAGTQVLGRVVARLSESEKN